MQVSDDEDDDDEDEDEDEEDEDDEEEVMMDEEPKGDLFTPSKRKKKQGADEVSNADSASTEPSTVPSEEDEETESAATPVDDGLPHPRVSCPFTLFSIFLHRTNCVPSPSNPAVTSSSARPTSGRRF